MTDMPLYQQAITVLLCTAATMLTRFLPFLVISARKPTPPLVRYLGNALPAAIFGLLVVYCLKDVAWGRPPAAWHAGTHRCRCHSWTASLVAPHAGLDGGRHSPLYVARPTRVFLSMWNVLQSRLDAQNATHKRKVPPGNGRDLCVSAGVGCAVEVPRFSRQRGWPGLRYGAYRGSRRHPLPPYRRRRRMSASVPCCVRGRAY